MTINDAPTLPVWAGENRKSDNELSLYLDPQRYLKHLDTLDISENQKLELLKTLWVIMGSFVDRAFGDDPVQQCRKGVGEIATSGDDGDSAVIKSRTEIHPNQNDLSSAFRQHVSLIPGEEELLR